MPAAPPPEGLPDWEDVRAAILGDAGARRPDGPLEVRETDPESAVPAVGRPARRALWIRPRGVLPGDPLVHAAVLAYASDRALLGTAARPHGLAWNVTRGVSLDHALWLHESVRLDDWVLYVSESPVCVAGRGLVLGAMYARTGRRIASVAQEGVIRAGR
jgi:acyl-CoA thioesterase-2